MAVGGLSRVQFLALTCMTERPWHGYALRQEIARRTGGSIRPGPASVHRTLRQLLDRGLVEETAERPDRAVDDPRRRYFAATEPGRRRLAAESARWLEIATQAQRALGSGD